MSTHTAQYVLLGVCLPYDNNSYEAYEAFAESMYDKTPRPGMVTIYDGRDGRYIFIGKILYRSDMDSVLDGPIDLSNAADPTTVELLSQLITITFEIEEPDIRVWFFTHYS